MNRGSFKALRTATVDFKSGFNEAPIHESGKWGLRLRTYADMLKLQ